MEVAIIITAVVLVLALGVLVALSKGRRYDVAGFIGLGLLVGFVIGMSESPLIASVATGVLTLAGVLIGKLMGDRSDGKTETKVEDRSETKTSSDSGSKIESKSVSTTTLSPSALIGHPIGWLFPLTSAALLGVILGVGTRINSTLDLQSRNVPARLKSFGFDDEQVKLIMSRLIKEMDIKQVVDINPTRGSGVRSHEVTADMPITKPGDPVKTNSFDWNDYWLHMNMKDDGYIISNILDTKNTAIPAEIREMVSTARANGRDFPEIVNSLKTLTVRRPKQ